MGLSYKDSASFGKRIEYKLIAQMLGEDLDVYTPLVDDHGVDCVIKRSDGTFIEIQIKARSKEKCSDSCSAQFGVIRHSSTPNYYFVFYSEILNKMWILSSEEFLKECNNLQSGKHEGLHSIKFNGVKDGKPYALDRFKEYVCENFSRFH